MTRPVKLRPRLLMRSSTSVLARVLPGHPNLHNLPLKALALEWDMHEQTLIETLTGDVPISGEDLLWMADELGATPRELLAGILTYRTHEERLERLRTKVANTPSHARALKLSKALAREKSLEEQRQFRRRRAALLESSPYTKRGHRRAVNLLLYERLPPNERPYLPPGFRHGDPIPKTKA